jgi:hypothetical protein
MMILMVEVYSFLAGRHGRACSAFQKKTGWAFLDRGRSSPENNRFKTRQTRDLTVA